MIFQHVSSAVLAAVIATFVLQAYASCPNHCNSNGKCDKYGRCSCNTGYQGADCSERICPFGLAWSDIATGTDVAHAEAECSNRGICNRKNAKCQCMTGFSGSACERLDCQDNCNGRGICHNMKDFAGRTRNENSESFTYTTRWDSLKIKGCQCDYPATGYDCGQTLCPNGDDPLTSGQVNEIQILQCASTAGSFVLYYNGVPSTSIPYTANAAMVKSALLSIPQISDVKVTFSQTHGTVCQIHPNVVIIEFTEQFGALNPLLPYLDAAFESSGGIVSVAADGVASRTDVSGNTFKSRKGTKEADLCANRGYCNLDDGLCACYDTNGDVYGSSDGYANAGSRGDCGYIVSASQATGVSTCPGALQCSGHGVCDTDTFRCYCSAGWYGGDCALMECPTGKSWFSYPTADESAHFDYDTCSNMGTCDTKTGKCQCRQGFYGEACQYMSCGGPAENPCNGHGRCMTMAELALWADRNGDATQYEYGSDVNDFATWDHDRVHGCYCDPGFSGYDCSLIDCPRGDDGGTYDDASEVQLLQCIADTGNFTLSFRQQKTPLLQFDITAAELQAELNKLSTIKNVAVYYLTDGVPPNDTLHIFFPEHPEGLPGPQNWGPTEAPVIAPTPVPTAAPSFTTSPSTKPTPSPSFNGVPTFDPTLTPTAKPTLTPTAKPTAKPTLTPTARPTAAPTGYTTNSGFCRTDGFQVAVLVFEYNHGDLPAIIPNTVNLGDLVNHNGEPFSGKINVFTDGAQVRQVRSVRGTTENDVCNNRGICDTTTGICQCFELWTSGDGRRQGGAGSTADCGYRNDQLFTNF